jgi:leader peptidase (prepilin peptidase)/N-methyltransferase
VVEILTAILFGINYVKFSPQVSFLAFLWSLSFVLFLIPISFIDLEKKIIPDSLSLGLLFLGWLLAMLKINPFFGFKHSILSALSGIGLLFLVNELYYLVSQRDGMGMGDFKLMGAIGAYLGYESFYSIILSASIIGILAFVGYFLYKRFFKKSTEMPSELMKFEIPFGPFLCLGALLYLYDLFRFNPF